jgi:hypothetical protein
VFFEHKSFYCSISLPNRDQNYSNPDDFPADYARRVWLAPVYYVPLIWPAYILDSPVVMAVQNVLLSAGNIVLQPRGTHQPDRHRD